MVRRAKMEPGSGLTFGGPGPVSPEAAAMRAPTPTEVKAALTFDRGNGTPARERDLMVANHLQERPSYYRELGEMLTVPMVGKMGGPFIGPKGGKWADAAHTIPWREPTPTEGHAARFLGATSPKAQAEALADWIETDYPGWFETRGTKHSPKGMRERVQRAAKGLVEEVSNPQHPDHEEALAWLAEEHEKIKGAPERARAEKDEARKQRVAAKWEAQGVEVEEGTPLSKLRGKKVWLYHGTTTKLVPHIEKHGLQSRSAHGKQSNVGSSGFQPSSDRVFLTARVDGAASASFYAKNAARKHGGEPVVVRVLVDGDDLAYDRDDADLSAGRYQFETDAVRPEQIMEIGGKRKNGKQAKLRKAAGGPFIGPQGGKWADAQHTIAWHEGAPGQGGAAPPPQAGPPKPGAQPAATAPKKPLPSADSIGQQGMQVVAAIRQHDPQLADEMEQALHAVVVGLRARQAGAKTPEGDSAIKENLKAFGRAFSQSAAPASVLGPDINGLLEAAEKTHARDKADANREAADALSTAKQGLANVTTRAQAMGAEAGASPEEQGKPAGAGTSESAAVKPQVGASEGADQGAAGESAEEEGGAMPAPFGGSDYQAPAAGADDDGIVDVFGIGSPDEVNRKFGHDPKAQERERSSSEALARLNAAAEARDAEPASETEAALRDVHALGAEHEQAQARAQQDAAQRQQYQHELASAKQRRDAVERAAAAQADRFAARNAGRRSTSVMREALGEPSAAQPTKAPISPERAEMRTMKPARGPKGPPEQQLTRALTPTMVKAIAGGRGAAPFPNIGPSNGAAPVTETPAIPDYQSIYFQPPDDARKLREEQAFANRRQADGDRSRGAFGFHGSGEVRLDPVLYYVPAVRTAAQVAGPQLAQREPIVMPDMVKPRLEAGGSQSPKDGVPVQAQTDAGRVPRSPDRRDDALAAPGPRPSPQLQDVRQMAKPPTSGEPRGVMAPSTGPRLTVPTKPQAGPSSAAKQPSGPVGPVESRPDGGEGEDEDESTQRAKAIVGRMSDEQLGFWEPGELVAFMAAGFRNADAQGFAKSEIVLEAQYLDSLFKGGTHKYIRRVPTGNPKRPWRYYYRESAIARDVQAGEEVQVEKGTIAKVLEVGKDGEIRLEMNGQARSVKPDEWANLLVRSYGTRFHEWAEKRAEKSINAVLKHVPRKLLEELPGDTDEARFEALRERVPEVYAKLQRSFSQAGVNPFRAKQILASALERRGWEPEARAAAVGSVLTKRTSATRFSEIVQGAENLAAGSRVTAGHVGAVVELRGGAPGQEDDFASRATELAKKAEVELAKLSELLAKAQEGSNADRAQALAAVLASGAIQKLNLLTQAFPGLRDKVADEARGIVTEAAAVAPHPAPKSAGGETNVYVAGEGGQPKAIRAKFRLMNASDVVASHDPLKGFKKREDYPENVQERAYHRDQAEQGKVLTNALRLNPAFVANTNPDAVNGPPVVMEHDGKLIALGGNSRTMSMQQAYAHHPEKAEGLKKYLAEHAHEFGFRAEDVEALEHPILVREIEPDDRSADAQRLLVRQLNESFTQGMDPRTMQVAMGRKLDEQALGALGNDMKEDETLAAFLASPRSERFVNALQRAGIIDQRNANQYLKKGTKLLNEDGRTLVERILVGRVVGDADILSNTGPRLVGNIAAAVPYMVQAKAYGAGYDVGSDLAVALSAYNDLQHRAETGSIGALDPKMPEHQYRRLFNYFDDLFGGRHPVVDNKNAQALLELLIRKPGPQQQAAVWRDFVKRASNNPEGQASLFGAAKTPGEVLRETVNTALKREDDEKPAGKKPAQEGPSLF